MNIYSFFVCVGEERTKGKEPQDAKEATLNSELMRGRGENRQANENEARRTNSYFLQARKSLWKRKTPQSHECTSEVHRIHHRR